MSGLILPGTPEGLVIDRPNHLSVFPEGFVSVYDQKEYVIDFSNWKFGQFPRGFWQAKNRIWYFCGNKDNGGHISRDTTTILVRFESVLDIATKVGSTPEQYQLLLECAYLLKETAKKNPRMKDMFSIEVIPFTGNLSDSSDETTVRLDDDGVQTTD